MGLRGGRVQREEEGELPDIFEGSLAHEIDKAMKEEWFRVKGTDLPDSNPKERQILFVAIARGLLNYLNGHPSDMVAFIKFGTGLTAAGRQVVNFDLNVEPDPP